MSMRPLDLQVIMPKVTEATKVQQVLKDNSEAQQSILSTQFQEQLNAAKEKVYERSGPEEVKIDKEKNSNGKQRRENKKSGKEKKTKVSSKSSHIDIKV